MRGKQGEKLRPAQLGGRAAVFGREKRGGGQAPCCRAVALVTKQGKKRWKPLLRPLDAARMGAFISYHTRVSLRAALEEGLPEQQRLGSGQCSTPLL